MKYDDFIAKWLGKAIDWDGMYGPQCVDEIAQYCVDNGKPVAYANACDWANNPALQGAFTWTANDPNDFNQVPKRGDIIVWSSALPGSGGAGHIAIFDMIVKPGVFQSLDQNWGGQYVHFIPNHTWDYVLGWWHAIPPPPNPEQIPSPPPPPPAPSPIPAPDPHPDPAPANPPADPEPTPGTPPAQPTPEPTTESTPEPTPAPRPTPESAQPLPMSLVEKIIWAVLAAIIGLLAWFFK